MDETSFSHLNWDSAKQIAAKLTDNADVKMVASVGVVIWSWMFGGHTEMLITIVVLVVLDTVTGVWKAARIGKVSTRKLCRFAIKLFVYSILMITASLVDRSIQACVPLEYFSDKAVMLAAMCLFIASTEAGSVLENVALLGFPIPKKVLAALEDYNAHGVLPKKPRRKK